jgi:hypothetical protein
MQFIQTCFIFPPYSSIAQLFSPLSLFVFRETPAAAAANSLQRHSAIGIQLTDR